MGESSSSPYASKSVPLALRLRALLLSFANEMPTATSTNRRMGPARRARLMGSPVGVATAAKMNTVNMIQRHHETSLLPESTPAKLRRTMRSGARNPIPKTKIVLRKKDRYLSTDTIFSTFSGVKPSRISRPRATRCTPT